MSVTRLQVILKQAHFSFQIIVTEYMMSISFFDDIDIGESDPSFEETSDDDDSGSDIEASNEDNISSEEDDITRVENENIELSDEEGLEVNNPDKDNNNQPITAGSSSATSSSTVKSSSSLAKSLPFLSSNGVRLWPPTTGGKLKSEAWKHGGFKKDNKGILLKDKVFCAHCSFSAKYCSSPTNLLRHIEKEHGDLVKEESDGPRLYQSKVTDFPTTSLTAVKKYPRDNQKQVNFKNCIIRWIIRSLRPFVIVKDDNLVKAFNLADPKLSIPCPETIKSEVSKLDVKHTVLVRKELQNVMFVTCTNDAGSSYGGSSFIDVNIHWLNEDFKLCSKILAVAPVENGKSAADYRTMVDDILDQFKVKSKCFLFTTDNEATMGKAFSSSERNGCLAHLQSNASKKGLKNVPIIRKLRSKIRKVATKFNKSNKFKKKVRKYQKKENISVRAISQEVKTRFTSTYQMLGSVLHVSPDGDIDEDVMNKNIKAINQALVETVNAREYQSLKLSKDSVEVMVNIFPILAALERGISLMGGQSYGTGSSVLPFLTQFNKLLQPKDKEMNYVTSLKREIRDYLFENTKKNLNFLALGCSSFLDKRWSTLSFLTDVKKKEVKAKIMSELQQLESEWEGHLPPPPKKRKGLCMDIDGDSEELESGDSQAEREFKSFEAERKLDPNEDPFPWWMSRKAKYPLLSQLARKYLAVMGTSTPAERVFSQMGRVLEKKRLRMKDTLFSSLMFLSDCDL